MPPESVMASTVALSVKCVTVVVASPETPGARMVAPVKATRVTNETCACVVLEGFRAAGLGFDIQALGSPKRERKRRTRIERMFKNQSVAPTSYKAIDEDLPQIFFAEEVRAVQTAFKLVHPENVLKTYS